MAGLIGAGRNTLNQATGGFQTVAGLESARNSMNAQLTAARNAQRSSMVTTGAGLGASIGINNLVGAGAAAAGGAGAGAAGAAGAAGGGWAIPAAAGVMPLGGTAAAGTAAAGTAAAGTAAAGTAAAGTAAAGTAAAGTAAAGATGAASMGTMAAIGAVATPLLIGAGAALLLDQLFDIF